MIIELILNQIFLMECFESIVVFINDGMAEVKSEAEVHEITTCEGLTLLDKLVNLKVLKKDERPSLSSIKDRLEIIRIKNKKQLSIKDFFK